MAPVRGFARSALCRGPRARYWIAHSLDLLDALDDPSLADAAAAQLAASAARSSPSGAWDDLARRALIVVIERLGATRAHAEASEAELEALRVAVTGGGGARFDLVHRVGASAAGDY